MTVALLTDEASVFQYLQEQGQGATQSADIKALIEQASDAIPRYCNREFTPSAGETRSFEFTPGRYLRPAVVDTIRYELRKVALVTLDPDINGGQQQLASTEWRLWPHPATPEGTFFGIRLADNVPRPAQRLVFPTRRVDIEGDWGTAAIPPLIKRYANETVAAWLDLPPDGRAFNDTEIGGEAPARPDDLPPGVRFGLKATFMRPQFPR